MIGMQPTLKPFQVDVDVIYNGWKSKKATNNWASWCTLQVQNGIAYINETTEYIQSFLLSSIKIVRVATKTMKYDPLNEFLTSVVSVDQTL